MKAKLDKLASFRINSERWEKFKEVAETQGKTATDLLNEYIDRVIGVGVGVGVDAAPKLSIRDIDKRIDDKINTASIQDVDTSVKKLITDSLEDGVIGDAIAKVQQKFSDENNELQRQIYALEESLEQLKSEMLSKIDAISENCSHQLPVTSQQSPVPSPQLPITNSQLPKSPEDVINFLGIEGILDGEEYWQEQLEIKGIDTKIKDNFEYFKSLGTEFKGVKDTAVSRFNRVLSWLGYKGTKQSTTIKQSDGSGVNKYLAIKVVPQNDN